MKVKEHFDLMIYLILGDWNISLFWTDRWLGEESLSSRSPSLFWVVADPEVTVEECKNGYLWGHLAVDFQMQSHWRAESRVA